MAGRLIALCAFALLLTGLAHKQPPRIPGFRLLGKNAQGLPEYEHEKTGIVFVLLPGGTFRMGSPPEERWRYPTEGPRHEVRVAPFLLARTELTQGVWKRIMGKGPWEGKPYVHEGEDYAASNLSWEDCRKFCEKTGLRFPSEAEWEYACRAGTDTAYSFGDEEERLGEYAWYDANTWEAYERFAHPVARKKPNPFGLYDMHGNVWEWCADRWHDDYRGAPTDGRPWLAGTETHRVIRGGGWLYDAGNCRSASRIRNAPTFRNDDHGFRPAASVPRR